MRYGDLPKDLGKKSVKCDEMLFYQYLPIKLRGFDGFVLEPRLKFLNNFIESVCSDYKQNFGELDYIDQYIYLTIKHQFQNAGNSYNRPGYHSDGFMTEDINYIWSDTNPTIFNTSNFNLTQDDDISLKEMAAQAEGINQFKFPDCHLLRLNQYNIHQVGYQMKGSFRTFIKVSFSRDKYDLLGNSHNYSLDYKWDMKPRKENRNIPQSTITQ